jgi:serine/threonine-protein kinase
MSLVGTTLGNIRIEAPLGMGGMGEVYRGFHLKLERRVAVKTIRRERRLSPAAKARLLREARLLSRLGHPGICQVYDLVETPAADFLVLELIDGKTLGELTFAPLPYEEKLRLAAEIAAVLAVAHEQQIVHRDVKPENVMVTKSGAVKMLDFGLARPLATAATAPANDADSGPLRIDRGQETRGPSAPRGTHDRHARHEGPALDPLRTVPGGEPPPPHVPSSSDEPRLTAVGSLVGTVLYMSPEQARGEEATTASDVYALGVLLQELFTHRPAYEPGSTGETLLRVARAETLPVDGLDPDLSRLIESMTELAAEGRPTAGEVATRLRWIRAKPQRLRRQRLQLVAAGAAVALLAVGLAVVSWLALDARRARDEAERRRKQAEGLIGFMVEDLRPKLEGAGRLDLLDAVGARALAYFAAVPEELLTDGELERRASAVRQLAKVRIDQGDPAASLAAARHSLHIASALAARDAERSAWQAQLAEARALVGEVLFGQQISLGEARALMEQARDTFVGLAAREPHQVEWRKSLAAHHLNVGAACEALGDLPAAMAAQRASIELSRQLLARSPGDVALLTPLSTALSWHSTSLEQSGDLAAAVRAREENLAILETLAARDPKNLVTRSDLGVAQDYLARLLIGRGDLAGAEALQRASLATGVELSRADPANATWKQNVAIGSSNLAVILDEAGRPAAALPVVDAAVAGLQALAAGKDDNPDWQRSLAAAYGRRGRILGALGRFAEARRELQRARAMLQPLLATNPGTVVALRAAEVSHGLGEVEALAGDGAAAQAAWEEALRTLPPLDRRADHRSVALRARLLLLLGRGGEARPVLERFRAMGGKSESLAALAKAQGLGS